MTADHEAPRAAGRPPTPVLHETDLFLPPADPDDHYDLAVQFALAARGLTALEGVLVDEPPDGHPRSSPALASIGQLCALTGLAPRVAVGGASPAAGPAGRGPDFVLDMLRRADRPVDVHVAGTARDVAAAAAADPGLFADRCRRLYLNAGSSRTRPGDPVEYNVALDPAAFRRLLELPCPVYWAPCFEVTGERVPGEYSSHWSLDQGAFLDRLPRPLRMYFVHALNGTVRDWLRCLDDDEQPSWERREERRSLWCTAGYLHGAGLSVRADGGLGTTARPGDVFDFVPAEWSCDDDGAVTWRRAPADTGRFVLRTDVAGYEAAMTRALATLLSAVA